MKAMKMTMVVEKVGHTFLNTFLLAGMPLAVIAILVQSF